MQQTWTVNTTKGVLIAYLYLLWYLLSISVFIYVLHKIFAANWPESYWFVYAALGLLLFRVIIQLRKFTPYSFIIDNDNNTLLIQGINMLGLKKTERITLVGLDTEFIRAYDSKGGIDSNFTLTLTAGDNVLLKIKQGYFGWNAEKLKGIHNYIQTQLPGTPRND